MIEDMNASLKIIVVGNGRVGKTTLTIKYVKNIYTTEYKKTLGVDFLNKQRYIKSIFNFFAKFSASISLTTASCFKSILLITKIIGMLSHS